MVLGRGPFVGDLALPVPTPVPDARLVSLDRICDWPTHNSLHTTEFHWTRRVAWVDAMRLYSNCLWCRNRSTWCCCFCCVCTSWSIGAEWEYRAACSTDQCMAGGWIVTVADRTGKWTRIVPTTNHESYSTLTNIKPKYALLSMSRCELGRRRGTSPPTPLPVSRPRLLHSGGWMDGDSKQLGYLYRNRGGVEGKTDCAMKRLVPFPRLVARSLAFI